VRKTFTPHPDRLFPADPDTRSIARRLYAEVRGLPIISPHGHTDPSWYAENGPFPDPAKLLLIPDHYVFRMLYSQGVRMEDLGIPTVDGTPVETDPRTIWRRFCSHWHLFRGTPSRAWWDYELSEVLGINLRICPENADEIYDTIDAKLKTPEYRPRALCERFNIEVLATTEGPLDDLRHHKAVRESGWKVRLVTAFRPDNVTDPEYYPTFNDNIAKLGEITGENTATWTGYLNALMNRRAFFKTMGATSTDHGHPTAGTANLSTAACEALFSRILKGGYSPAEAELFRSQMLTEMARMSIEDGLVMQIHSGCKRSHNEAIYKRFGRDKGGDIPTRDSFVDTLKPMLDLYGNDPRLSVILFTMDETTYARELAPLAGHYPTLKLGPSWWFHDSPEGMARFRRQVTETAGFYNTVGFNDDTRALLSIPARHDIARRADCAFLAGLVAEHRLDEDEAVEVARDLTYHLVKAAYKL